MSQFRKKPVVVEAAQWFKNGDHPEDRVDEMVPDPLAGEGKTYKRLEGAVVRFFRHPTTRGDHPCQHCSQQMHVHGWIDTSEGGHIVCPGDWIITGVKGERYPCKPDIFAATYEPADVAPGVTVPDSDSALIADFVAHAKAVARERGVELDASEFDVDEDDKGMLGETLRRFRAAPF
jgi:hypothetical protein